MDSIFNRNLELAINKNEYMPVYPNINNLMLYSYAIKNNTNYIIIDCYCLVEVDEDGEYGKIEVLGYDTESAEFTRGF